MNVNDNFGRLTVRGIVHSLKHHNLLAFCECSCGQFTYAGPYDLNAGKIASCGCLRREMLAAKNKARATHHGKGTTEFRSWTGMRARCLNPTNKAFSRYGGRGITICDRWNRFENFLADMGKRPGPGYSIDRYPDNDGPYSPDNCRWATYTQQNRNRRSTRFLTANGITLSYAEWADKTGVPLVRIWSRVKKGFPPELAILDRDFHVLPRKTAEELREGRQHAARRANEVRWGQRRNAPPPEPTPSPVCATNGQFEAQEVVCTQ